MAKSFWNYGEQTEIAKLIGMSASHLNEITSRKRGVGKKRAFQLEAVGRHILGVDRAPSWQDWLFNKRSEHPAFVGRPRKEY